jgi:phosphatidylglycerophosphate synthase
MKNLPNIITSVRLLAALLLLFECLNGQATRHFLGLFGAAGVSDMLDGFLARRFNCCTEFGARLDSISDLLLYLTVLLFLALNATVELSACAYLLILGAFAQVLHISFALFKLHQYPSYHSTFSRACAYVLFFGIISFWLTKNVAILQAVMLLWTATCLEGIVITKILKRGRNNVDSIKAARQLREADADSETKMAKMLASSHS